MLFGTGQHEKIAYQGKAAQGAKHHSLRERGVAV